MSARILATRANGSVFGPARAWLKRDGRVVNYPSLDAAQADALRLNAATLSTRVTYEAVQF